MKKLPSNVRSLRDGLGDRWHGLGRFLSSPSICISLHELVHGSTIGDDLPSLSGQSVLIATRDPIASALALIELDGVVRRLTICPPDLPAHHLPLVVENAGVNAIVCDHDLEGYGHLGVRRIVGIAPAIAGVLSTQQFDRYPTEWVLLTSGTTGQPKMVLHNLASLTTAIKASNVGPNSVIWGTFYDVRRYGGLQILFRAILAGGSFVLSGGEELLGQYLVRLGEQGATHVLGTPSHWRRVLMSPSARAISPQYVRLSGEIADQAILDGLHACYPQARVSHAFASTEAGVAFEVDDGLEGFPTSIIGRTGGDVDLKVEDGSLRIRSPGIGKGYVSQSISMLADDDGFVDTGDMLECRGDRYYFLGRRGGIINVGGLKIHPEEVEAVINRHPAVRMCSVQSRKNPITGSIVVANVVLKVNPDGGDAHGPTAELKEEISRFCRNTLAPHKVPAVIRFVADLDVGATGKLARHA